jgi:adenosylmethionine-8-amino-7-oxononanoate aminotransferase
MTMGKGMTAGYLPMFATAVSQRIYQAFVDSGEMLYHGFTYTGQPALSAAALKVMEILETENLIQRVNEVGRVFAQKSQELLEYPWVGEVRNIGMLGGIEFVADKKTKAQFGPEKKFIPRFTMALRKQGVLSRVVRGDTLVLAPPFVITEAEMDELFRGIRGAIEEVCPTV